MKLGLLPFRTGHCERIAKVIREFPFPLEDECLHLALANAFADEIEFRNSFFNREKFIKLCGIEEVNYDS